MKHLLSAACILALVIGLASMTSEPTTAQTNGGGVPTFDWDPLFYQNLPNRWTTGQVGGISVDDRDHTWIAHRPASVSPGERSASLNPPAARCCTPAPPVLEFDQNGRFVRAFGGPSDAYEWPTTEHGVYADHKGNVWVAGNGKGDNHILKFTNTGTFVMQIGRRNQAKGSNDTANVHGAASMVVFPKTNELFVADGYTNHRVIVFDADTGAYKRHWGAYGKPPDDTYKFPPRPQLIVGPPQPQFHNPVHSVVVSNDGLVYVGDRSNNRIQVFKLDGSFVREVYVNRDTLQNEGTVHNFALSRDPQQRYLFVADGSNKVLMTLDRATMTLLSSFGGQGGHNARQFFHLHSLASQPDSKGNLYVGEVNEGMRFYRLRYTGLGKPQNPGYAAITSPGT
jgi:DNA-binding beta-propeller fold protein YncE